MLSAADGLEHAARVAFHGEYRVHDQVHADVHLAEDDADGVHQEGHVGRDHAQQHTMRGRRRIDVERRRQVHEHAVAGALPAEIEMRQACRGEIARPVGAQVFFRDVAEEGAQEIAGQRL